MTKNIFYYYKINRHPLIVVSTRLINVLQHHRSNLKEAKILTYGAKVLVQNTCSLFSNPETTSESQKQLVRLRIFRSFRIWVQKFCVSFCYGIMKESLKDLERQFGQKCFSYILKIRIRNQMLKLLLIYQFVELNLLYKMHYFTFFLSFKKVPSFSFFSMILILRKAPF